jgi:hypothetical protein
MGVPPKPSGASRTRPIGAPSVPHALAYFTDNGADGLHLALSDDGLAWHPVAGGLGLFRAEVGDENLMRDPFILPAPDGSGYHLLWTTGWRGRSLGYAFSTDLLHWSGARALPVAAALPDAENAWAPEAIFDPATGDYLVYFATRQPSRYEGHRMLAIRTRDFRAFTGPEIFYDPGHSVIDAHLVPDPVRARWVMIVKDERPGHKRLFTATAPTPAGPWSAPSAPISDLLTEGATTLRTAEGWLVLYDAYGEHRTRAFTTPDLATFAACDAALGFDGFPARVRHPTAFPIPPALACRLRSHS